MAAQEVMLTLAIVMVTSRIALGHWIKANATFYGDVEGKGNMYGACGYSNLFQQGYGLETTALSTVLFNKGKTCGACYEIKCLTEPKRSWCIPKAGSIIVTATNLCPPSFCHPSRKDFCSSSYCDPPQKHFSLTRKMFTKIAYDKAEVIPIIFRRVPCLKQGGVKFEMKGDPVQRNVVLVYNVGGFGDVVDVKIKGSNTRWIQMIRTWGQNWSTETDLRGQSVSFLVTTSDRKRIQFDNVVPANWKFGQTYDGGKNF